MTFTYHSLLDKGQLLAAVARLSVSWLSVCSIYSGVSCDVIYLSEVNEMTVLTLYVSALCLVASMCVMNVCESFAHSCAA